MAFWLAVGRRSAASAFGFDFMMIMIRLGEAFIKMVIFLINVFGFDFLINEKVDRNKVLFRATYWVRFWVKLQRCEEDKEAIHTACRNLESISCRFSLTCIKI
uniref:Uncharacterized protein n=1 Tax=Oryza barthii TaxID=65489 RepID=A0A0D3HAJ2_9ORYZ